MTKSNSERVKESRESKGLKSRSLYVDPKDWDRLKLAAKKEGMALGEFVFFLLDRHEGKNSTDWPRELRRLAADLEQRT